MGRKECGSIKHQTTTDIRGVRHDAWYDRIIPGTWYDAFGT